MKNQIQEASRILSEKIQAHFSSMNLADCIKGMESLREQVKLRSIEIMKKACENNDYNMFKLNLAEYMADSYELACQFKAGEEADNLSHLIFKDEESIKVYWECQNNGRFNKEMDAANAALDEAIESLKSLIAA